MASTVDIWFEEVRERVEFISIEREAYGGLDYVRLTLLKNFKIS